MSAGAGSDLAAMDCTVHHAEVITYISGPPSLLQVLAYNMVPVVEGAISCGQGLLAITCRQISCHAPLLCTSCP